MLERVEPLPEGLSPARQTEPLDLLATLIRGDGEAESALVAIVLLVVVIACVATGRPGEPPRG